MSSMNKVILIGNLGRDPESRSFQNGGQVVNIRIATSEHWKDRNTGEKRERTEWHSIAIFAEHACRYATQYLRKGSKVMVEGQLETRKWQDQSGQDRYTTEVVIRPYSGRILGLDRAGGNQGDDYNRQGPQGGAGGGNQGGGYSDGPPDDRNRAPDLDDEIPF